ncbi:MAG: hypothetical protein KAX38_06005, partial [Candidatus Krumholzibacteria bacterium]|nr:hypothetical protein [Candidatus Krumholzibacteria bacterium]
TTNPASNSITLTWTATGDDSISGTASYYDIRYSLSFINPSNFNSATVVYGEPHPQPSGSPESFTVIDLDFNTTYYFAVKVVDKWGNSSGVSNSPSGTTLGIPQIAVSPDSLSDSLLTGASSTQYLTIRNVGEGTLDFFVSIADVEVGSVQVDFFADESVRDDKIFTGSPVSLEALEDMRASFPKRMTVQSTNPVDKDMPFSREHSSAGPLKKVAGEEVFGSDENSFFAGPRTRGNLFTCTNSTTLIEHRLHLNPPTSTQLWLLVYEGDSQVGIYDLISASDVTPAGPGKGWYSSGEVNVLLVEGMYYLIVASFEQSSYYYNQQNISPYPIPASFGELTAGAGWSWSPTFNFPPDLSQDVPSIAFRDPVAYYQMLVTG